MIEFLPVFAAALLGWWAFGRLVEFVLDEIDGLGDRLSRRRR